MRPSCSARMEATLQWQMAGEQPNVPVGNQMEPLEDSDPRQIGPFRLLYRLGAGGMGRVYLGLSRGNRAVALKVIHPFLAVDPVFVASFRREAEAAKAVSGAFTAPVLAAGLDDAQPWLATAYVEGPSLAEAVIERASPLPEPAVWRLAGGLVEALQAVHASGLVHRDLKPANVLLDLDGPKVIDFGISRALQDIFTTIGRRDPIGTPAYMSPEQAQGNPVGPESDVFSLGSVIAFAATGKVLFGATMPVIEIYRVINEEPDLSAIGEPLRGLVRSCLEKAPADRPSLDDLLDTITAASTAFSALSPYSFWPRQLASYIRTRNDVTDPRRSLSEPALPSAPVPAEEEETPTPPTAPPIDDAAIPVSDEPTDEEPAQEEPTAEEPIAEQPAAEAAFTPRFELAQRPGDHEEAPRSDELVLAEASSSGLVVLSEAAKVVDAGSSGVGSSGVGSSGVAVRPDRATELAEVTALTPVIEPTELQLSEDPITSGEATPPPGKLAALEPTEFVADPSANGLSANGANPHDDEPAPVAGHSNDIGVLTAALQPAAAAPPVNGAAPRIAFQLRRRLFAIGAGVVTAGILAGLAYAVWPGPSTVSPATASVTLPVKQYDDGLGIVSTWTLSSADGESLTEKITATDTKPANLTVQYREPVPVAALTHLGAAQFTPSGPMIIDHGHGLVWSLHLTAGGQAIVSYKVGIAGGAVSRARLRRLLQKFTGVQAGPIIMKPPPVTLQSLTIMPKSLQLHVGHSERLSLVGRLSNGKAASASILAGVRWTTMNSHVATVNKFGKITAVALGKTKIIATVGTLSTFIYLDVIETPSNSIPYSSSYTQPYTSPTNPSTHTVPPTTPITTTPHSI